MTDSHRFRLRGAQPRIRGRGLYKSNNDRYLGSSELAGPRPMKSPYFLPKWHEALMVIEEVFIYTAQSPQKEVYV